MDDGSGSGAAVCEGVDVGHDIVPELALLLGRHGEVDVLFVALHLLNLGVRDGQTQSLRRRAKKTEREEGKTLLTHIKYYIFCNFAAQLTPRANIRGCEEKPKTANVYLRLILFESINNFTSFLKQ